MGKKRIVLINEKLNKIVLISSLKTQELRVRLISELEKLFIIARKMAESAENKDDWVRIAGYIAQVINSLANSYDETRFNEDMKRLEEMIQRAKKKLTGQTGAGTPIA